MNEILDNIIKKNILLIDLIQVDLQRVQTT